MKRIVKKFLATLIAIYLLVLGSTAAWATDIQNDTSTDFKQILLHSVAYYEAKCVPPDSMPEAPYSLEIENSITKLSDEDLREQVSKHLKSVIERKQRGERIVWDADFVEKVVKVHFPDLYLEIAEQIKEDGKSREPVDEAETQLHISVVQPFYDPGSKTYDFVVTGKSVLGSTLYDFVCRIYWAWDATKLTTVLPSTFGRVYDPIWNYDGIKSNIEYFVDPAAYRKYVEGHFYSSIAGYTLQHNYPWLDITIYAGGGAIWTPGIKA